MISILKYYYIFFIVMFKNLFIMYFKLYVYVIKLQTNDNNWSEWSPFLNITVYFL